MTQSFVQEYLVHLYMKGIIMVSNNALLEIHGTRYHLNEEGRLQNNEDWNEEVAVALAEGDGIVLNDDHWKIIHLLRDFYKEFNHSPLMKLFLKETGNKLGKEYSNQEFLNKLFPGDVLILSTKIAGVPTPHKASLIKDTQPGEAAKAAGSDSKKVNEQPSEFIFDGVTYHLTVEGNLIENYAWTESMAEYLAEK